MRLEGVLKRRFIEMPDQAASSHGRIAGLEDSDPPKSSTESLELNDMLSDDDTLNDDEETGLTEAERKSRTRRKNENIRLDGRVAGDSGSGRDVILDPGGKIAEQKLLTPIMVKNLMINALLIGLWYSFSISISVYNKWMFSGENLDFHYPLFVTSLHMLVQFSLASTVLYFIPRFRPGYNDSYAPISTSENEQDEAPPPTKPSSEPLMTRWFYLSRIGPCGTATALDIGLGNFSLRFISLTFFTMCKSSVLAFVLLFAFIFHLEQPTWRLCAIILFMTVGVIMMVAGETAFNALGFVLVMIASLCSGFRWSLTQILLLRNRATSNPFSSIFFLTPVMFVALFALALPIEGPGNVIQGIKDLSASEGGFLSFILLLFPGLLAFLMVSAEFALLQRTSVVTLSVCGIFKEVLTISAAGIVFGDELSPINISGLFVTIASIAAYNFLKYSKMRKAAEDEVHQTLAGEPGTAHDTGAGAGQSSDGRRDSTSALMSDNLHLSTDFDPGDLGYDSSMTNGVVKGGSGKSPEHID